MERHFSQPRLARYCAKRQGSTELATADYRANLLMAESLVPLLQVLEVALRNGVCARLRSRYKRADWWEAWNHDSRFARQLDEVASVRQKLTQRGECITPDKIIAELTFGFWCSLFNARLQTELWKDLRLVFAKCPKDLRRRHAISTLLNQIRNLRNRVFHHEPLLWLTPPLLEQHAAGTRAIGWIDPELVDWLTCLDRAHAVWRANVDLPASPEPRTTIRRDAPSSRHAASL